MIETQIYQTFCVSCDQCGRQSNPPLGCVESARKAAIKFGFHLEQWTEHGCFREYWHCHECWLSTQELPKRG